jgi:F420-dependent oxidoreductase-like protein
VRIGIHYANFSHPNWQTGLLDRLTETARVADEGGAELFTLMDHWFQMENLGGPAEPMLEGYTSLGFLAGQTSRIELGLLVTGVTYRHPGLLTKIVTTLDVLSRGRAMLGLGAAWYEREHRGLGVPYPPTKERFERLEETLQIVKQAWGPGGTYEGTHYRLEELTVVPQPLRPGGPRIVVGGTGERKTLRLVARYADACNLFATGTDEVAHKLDVLRRHCDDLGRDHTEIAKTIVGTLNRPLDDVDSWLATMQEYADLGITQVWVGPDSADPVGWTEQMCDQVLPRLADVGA